jgi:hypothetical protein
MGSDLLDLRVDSRFGSIICFLDSQYLILQRMFFMQASADAQTFGFTRERVNSTSFTTTTRDAIAEGHGKINVGTTSVQRVI